MKLISSTTCFDIGRIMNEVGGSRVEFRLTQLDFNHLHCYPFGSTYLLHDDPVVSSIDSGRVKVAVFTETYNLR